jgi:hypothetical protein
MKYKIIYICLMILFCGTSSLFSQTVSKKIEDSSQEPAIKELNLVQAVMCEGLKGYIPHNPAVVFSISTGKISCFTSFDAVPEEMFIHHRWFRREKLATEKKLVLKPPSWSTFSSIQLRASDKGPWRVEITGPQNKVFQTLRFSITD